MANKDLSLSPYERREKIINHIVDQGSAVIEDLVELLGVSPMTVYRDVSILEELKLVTKKRGEVSAAESSLMESSSKLRLHRNEEAKTRLANAALEHLNRGQTVMLDDSTTLLPILKNINELTPLTVITNSNYLAKPLRIREGIKLVLIGGQYEAWADAYFGVVAETAISTLSPDVCLMSTTSIKNGSHYHPDENVARLKRCMLQAAAKSILLVDSSKFTRSALHKIGPITDFDLVIADYDTSKEHIDTLRDTGVEVQICKENHHTDNAIYKQLKGK